MEKWRTAKSSEEFFSNLINAATQWLSSQDLENLYERCLEKFPILFEDNEPSSAEAFLTSLEQANLLRQVLILSRSIHTLSMAKSRMYINQILLSKDKFLKTIKTFTMPRNSSDLYLKNIRKTDEVILFGSSLEENRQIHAFLTKGEDLCEFEGQSLKVTLAPDARDEEQMDRFISDLVHRSRRSFFIMCYIFSGDNKRFSQSDSDVFANMKALLERHNNVEPIMIISNGRKELLGDNLGEYLFANENDLFQNVLCNCKKRVVALDIYFNRPEEKTMQREQFMKLTGRAIYDASSVDIADDENNFSRSFGNTSKKEMKKEQVHLTGHNEDEVARFLLPNETFEEELTLIMDVS